MNLLRSIGVTIPEAEDLEYAEGGGDRDPEQLRDRLDIIAVSGLLRCNASFRPGRYVIDPLGGAQCSRARRGRYEGPIQCPSVEIRKKDQQEECEKGGDSRRYHTHSLQWLKDVK